MQTLRRTPLYEQLRELGARMVPFAGWEMPVQFEGVIPEHRAVRTDSGVFDVSHMGELEVRGPGAAAFLQSALSNDVKKLSPGAAQYTLLTNEQGGIQDDLIAYRHGEEDFLLIVNASNTDSDVRWLSDRVPADVELLDVSDRFALLAVQGPRSIDRLALPDAPPFTFTASDIDGVTCTVNRTGYTGERGVELLVAADDAAALWERVLARGVVPCGLGARDTLRLEACFPLHGNDIDPDTDAISAGLGFACALDTEFTGVEALRRSKEAGPARRLVPFVLEESGVPRAGMTVAEGGEVTSGSHSPMLDRGIGLGYVDTARAGQGESITIDIRGRHRRARIVSKPIYTSEKRGA